MRLIEKINFPYPKIRNKIHVIRNDNRVKSFGAPPTEVIRCVYLILNYRCHSPFSKNLNKLNSGIRQPYVAARSLLVFLGAAGAPGSCECISCSHSPCLHVTGCQAQMLPLSGTFIHGYQPMAENEPVCMQEKAEQERFLLCTSCAFPSGARAEQGLTVTGRINRNKCNGRMESLKLRGRYRTLASEEAAAYKCLPRRAKVLVSSSFAASFWALAFALLLSASHPILARPRTEGAL